jgi:hypothetical protein
MSATVQCKSKCDVQIKTALTIMFVCLLSCSCASQVDVLKPSGEQATVTLCDMTKHKVELLVVSDSVLHVVEGGRISFVNLSDVQNVYVHGYRISGPQMMLGAIPVLFLEGMVAYLTFSEGWFQWCGLFSVILIPLTIHSYAKGAGEPEVSFSSPFDETEVRKLKLYVRYPQGLTDQQRNRLLRFHGQADLAPLTTR